MRWTACAAWPRRASSCCTSGCSTAATRARRARASPDFVLGELRLGVPSVLRPLGLPAASRVGPGRARRRPARPGAVLRPAPACARRARVLGGDARQPSRCSGAIDHPLAPSPAQLRIFAVFAQDYVGATIGRLDPPMWTLGVEVVVLRPAAVRGAARHAPRGAAGRAARAVRRPARRRRGVLHGRRAAPLAPDADLDAARSTSPASPPGWARRCSSTAAGSRAPEAPR